MKKLALRLFVITGLLASNFQILTLRTEAFFVGFGGAGAGDIIIRRGQEEKVIPAMPAPGNLKAVAVTRTRIDLTWQDNSIDELGFRIERKSTGSAYTEIAVVGANVSFYADSVPDTDKVYCYRVRAYNATGVSEYSNEATISSLPEIPEWHRTDMGCGGDYMYSVAVGNGRNDGVMRVYGANRDGSIYEFTWNNIFSSWTQTYVGSGSGYMMCIAVGAGRNDGVMRVYGASYDGHLYEFTWNETSSSWTKVDVGSGGLGMDCVAIGAGRNDGITRVYGANADFHLYEFSFY